MYQPFFLLLAYRPRPEPDPRTALAGLGPGLGLEKSQARALESQAKATASRPSRAVTSLRAIRRTSRPSDRSHKSIEYRPFICPVRLPISSILPDHKRLEARRVRRGRTHSVPATICVIIVQFVSYALEVWLRLKDGSVMIKEGNVHRYT